MNVQAEHADRVEDEASFARFLGLLADDRREAVERERIRPSSPYGPDVHGWEHGTIENFLEAAWAAWDGNMSAHGRLIGVSTTNPWTRAAHILLRGKFYE